jgi:hypothetical protein
MRNAVEPDGMQACIIHEDFQPVPGRWIPIQGAADIFSYHFNQSYLPSSLITASFWQVNG